MGFGQQFGVVLSSALLGLVLAPVTISDSAAQDSPIVLRAITPWTADYPSSEPMMMFERLVEERLGGRLRVDYLGGPEVVPAFEQFEALRNGVVDLIIGAAAYYTGQVPEASAMLLARKSPQELRETGYHDLMRELHLEKGGVVYLSNLTGVPNVGFRLYLNERIEEPDLSGLSIRVSPVYVPLVNGLGGTPVNMPTTDIYTALERGVVQGFGQTYIGIMDFGLHEVTNYVVDIPFYSKDNALLMNADVWNGLPDDIKAEIEEILLVLEDEITEFVQAQLDGENDKLREAGLEFIEFDEEGTQKFLDAAYDARWNELIEQSPEIGERLRELGG